MFKKIIAFFTPKSSRFRDDYYAQSEQIYNDVAARFARGNVAMQMGHILTREQLDKELDALEIKIAERNK